MDDKHECSLFANERKLCDIEGCDMPPTCVRVSETEQFVVRFHLCEEHARTLFVNGAQTATLQ